MQGQAQQQAYDRGITIFSPDGRLYQVEYAREAVKRGTASIGVRTEGGVVLAVDKRIRSELMERTSVEKIHKADDHIGIASAGHVADARQLIDFARRRAQVNRLRYGEPIGVETLTKDVTDHIQQYTQVGGARPFGVALIIGGIEDGEPRQENYAESMDLDGGIELELRALATVNDDELSPEGVGVATVDVETEQFLELSNDETEEYLAELGLLAEDGDTEPEEE
ncbi:proteasome subunit alpha [Halobacteriales archaeon QS_1_67_19]|nr:MAG: proteasome subunit alpha [Halobacteriales archaeon QS_1_67_19]